MISAELFLGFMYLRYCGWLWPIKTAWYHLTPFDLIPGSMELWKNNNRIFYPRHVLLLPLLRLSRSSNTDGALSPPRRFIQKHKVLISVCVRRRGTWQTSVHDDLRMRTSSLFLVRYTMFHRVRVSLKALLVMWFVAGTRRWFGTEPELL